MLKKKATANVFHRIGDGYSNYIDRNHFLGQDALTDMWDIRHHKDPLEIRPDFSINIYLPGFKEDEVSVEAHKNNVRIRAATKAYKTEGIRDEYFAQELKMESYDESFTIPDDLNTDELRSDYDGKYLKISIPYLPK